MFIGKVKIDGPVMLAPLAGITNSPFRRIAKSYGASLVYTEMICAKGITHNNKLTHRIAFFENDEKPISYQIFGDIPENMGLAAKFAEESGADIIDINIGCPQSKIAKGGTGAGAALMQREISEDVISAVVNAVDIPVTIKIRSGWKKVNAVEFAKMADNVGVAAIGVHPRLGVQRFSGVSDWDIIRQVKEAVNVPVIGSGDLNTADDCNMMVEKTGCDAVMLARGIRGAPWMINEAVSSLQGKKMPPKLDLREKLDVLMQFAKDHYAYLDRTSEVYGLPKKDNLNKCLRDMRKFVHWFLKGYPRWLRDHRAVYDVKTLEEFSDLLDLINGQYETYSHVKKL